MKHFGEPDSTEGTEDGVAYWQTGSGRSPDLGGDRLRQALEQWRQCMAPLGIAYLTTPLEFPTPALANQWQLNSDIPLLELGDSPSADEVRIAVHDATCQESSGWAQAYYEESWRVDEEFVRENYAELEALQAEYADLGRRYEAAIAAR
ncbi:hypothetical protein [Buchananella hordeovulneris]|uniref:hypothetical protein n=1 Tax=Buchananella hordeovulneris TaxID=52770 RepID=UPI0011610752|nr:hypothetical protein [Buchananella hordeovulneris]